MSFVSQLFHTLQMIIRGYTRLGVNKLIDHFLRVKIIIQPTQAQIQAILSETDIAHAEKMVFLKSKQQKMNSFVVVVIDHDRFLDLAPGVLSIKEECVVLDRDGKQENNVIGWKERKKEEGKQCRAVLLKVTGGVDYEQIIEDLDSYLSICELFHGHTHLIVNCFQLDPFSDLQQHLKLVEHREDELDGMEEGYLRIVHERASRITLDELSEDCLIERRQWGELLIFEGGQDGIIVWLTRDCLPLLGTRPQLTLSPEQFRNFPIFCERPMGLVIFKAKRCFKTPMEELNFTTLIFNARKSQEAQKVQSELDSYCETFFGQRAMKRQMEALSTGIASAQRLCELLEVQSAPLIQHLLKLL